MIHYYRINDEGRVEAVASAAEATWIHLESSSEELLQSFADTYSFPSDYLTSTLDPDEVSRAENLHQKDLDLPVLLLLLYPVAEGDKGSGCFITETISIVLLDKLVITSARNTPGFFQDLRDNRYDLVRDLQDSRGIVIEIAWRIAKSFVEASRVVRGTMDQLQEELSKSTRSEHLLRLADLDKSIVFLTTALDENRPILEGMSDAPYLLSAERDQEWLHDVLVENHQADCMASQTNKMLEQLDTSFSSIIQNNLNVIMKVLTSITIIITIPMIIAGLWGMNVALPFMDSKYAFVLTLLLMLVLMLAAFILLKRKDLL